MTTTRRELVEAALAGLAGIALADGAASAQPCSALKLPMTGQEPGKRADYGLLIQYKAKSGKRDELMAIMRDGLPAMEGSTAWLIAADNRTRTGFGSWNIGSTKQNMTARSRRRAGRPRSPGGQALVDRVVLRVELKPL